MVDNVALVLGGGGAAGQAWQVGVLAGLAEAGFDVAQAAELVIGTSAGATTAVWARGGAPLARQVDSILSAPVPSTAPARPVVPSGHAMATVFARMRDIGASATSAAELRRAMGAFGLECDADAEPGAAAARRAVVASRLPRHDWPDRPMIVVAVDARTGELAAFDRDSGVDLVDAVAASTALPGLVPTVAINGSHYIDGGVRSADNADLAAGYATVVVLAPLGGRDRAARPGQFEGLRRFPGTDLDSQVEALRAAGSRVEVITPDPGSRAAMGTNQLDPATRVAAAQAGLAQGRRVGRAWAS